MIRVLLVEDDAMIREMTRIFLESQKRFEVVCAASGEEALAHAKDPFDAVSYTHLDVYKRQGL